MDRCNFKKAILKNCDFSRANVHLSDFTEAVTTGSDFTGCYGRGSLWLNATANATHFKRVSFKNALFINTDLTSSDVVGAELLGAKFDGAITTGLRNVDLAIFYWWLSPYGGPPSYQMRPGWKKLEGSFLGGVSIQENAARKG